MSGSVPRLALACFAVAMAVVYGIVSWLSPLQVDDWLQWTWAARHPDHSAWAWLASHYTFADAIAYALARSLWFHTIVTPLVCVALVIGVFTIAMRRLPRADAWDDVLGVMLVSALIWIAQPRAGYVQFHRPHVAWQIYGCALAAWTIAPFVCGWRLRGAATVLLAIAAFLVGGTTRQIATATLVAVVVSVLRTPRDQRARWMWIVVSALVAGTAVGFIDAPHVEIPKMINRGLEQNLLILNLPIREGGQLVILVMLLALGKLVLDLIRPGEPTDLPDAGQTLRWFWIWCGICVLALFGPRYTEATVFPATLALCAAALPWFRWLTSTRALRFVIATVVIGLHVIVWAAALATFVPLGAEFRARMAILETAPKGSTAVIQPYSELQPTPWFYGEDWPTAARQLNAIEIFGLGDIEFASWFRKLEANPRTAIRLEIAGATVAQIRDAAPAIWATELTNARTQFEVFAKNLERTAGKTFTARLVVDNLPFPERAGRPLYAAWYEHGTLTAPRTTRTLPDANDRQNVGMPGELAEKLPEAYLVRDGKGTRITSNGGGFRLQPMEATLVAIVACDAQRCFAVDAFLPRF